MNFILSFNHFIFFYWSFPYKENITHINRAKLSIHEYQNMADWYRITAVLKVETDMITNIAASLIGEFNRYNILLCNRILINICNTLLKHKKVYMINRHYCYQFDQYLNTSTWCKKMKNKKYHICVDKNGLVWCMGVYWHIKQFFSYVYILIIFSA